MNLNLLNKNQVAGVVVLYNSAPTVLVNIESYRHQIDRLYVVDNSPLPNPAVVKVLISLPGLVYNAFGENRGVAAALNWAARQAISDGYSLLLTMDDDTVTPIDTVARMLKFWRQYGHPIGIVSGIHHAKFDLDQIRSVAYTLTSGNLLNLKAYEQVGGFLEELFIDHVDHEYGLKLNQAGFQVIELTTIRLNHSLGYCRQVTIGNKILLQYGTHSPVRSYYFARNGLFLMRQYGSGNLAFSWMVVKELLKRLGKTLFFDASRMERLRLLIKGLADGWHGRLGPYQDIEDRIREHV